MVLKQAISHKFKNKYLPFRNFSNNITKVQVHRAANPQWKKRGAFFYNFLKKEEFVVKREILTHQVIQREANEGKAKTKSRKCEIFTEFT